VQTQLVFAKIAQSYERRSLWSPHKAQWLAGLLLEGLLERGKAAGHEINNLYHRLLHLAGYLRVSRDPGLKDLAAALALACCCDMHGLPPASSLDLLVEQSRTAWPQLFAHNSYSMFNLLELLDILIAQLVAGKSAKAQKAVSPQKTPRPVLASN